MSFLASSIPGWKRKRYPELRVPSLFFATSQRVFTSLKEDPRGFSTKTLRPCSNIAIPRAIWVEFGVTTETKSSSVERCISPQLEKTPDIPDGKFSRRLGLMSQAYISFTIPCSFNDTSVLRCLLPHRPQPTTPTLNDIATSHSYGRGLIVLPCSSCAVN